MSRKIFLSADFHFNHGNIIKYCKRPFLSESDKAKLSKENIWKDGVWIGDAGWCRMDNESVRLMDSTILDNINKIVRPEDELWFLGDFCFAHKNLYYQTARQYRDRILCDHVFLVKGNHDQDCIGGLFENVYDQTQINVNGQCIVLNHYAMATWDGSHRNTWQLYGHSHSAIENWMDAIMPGRRSMDVGVDNAYRLLGEFRPFSFEDLQKILGNRSGHRQKIN